MTQQPRYWAFDHHSLVAEGELLQVALQLNRRDMDVRATSLALFEQATGRIVDFDLRGTATELAERYPAAQSSVSPTDRPSPKTRGRPKLGVVGREVTLLPRHWQWLEQQRGGASAALRRLIDQARKANAGADAIRLAQDHGNRFMGTIAGDLPGYEDAVRALYSSDKKAFEKFTQRWPSDVRKSLNQLVGDAFAEPTT